MCVYVLCAPRGAALVPVHKERDQHQDRYRFRSVDRAVLCCAVVFVASVHLSQLVYSASAWGGQSMSAVCRSRVHAVPVEQRASKSNRLNQCYARFAWVLDVYSAKIVCLRRAESRRPFLHLRGPAL